jgi:cytochrome c oxidase subunit 2
MSLSSPQQYWWDEPLDQHEKNWLWVAGIFCVIITLAMPYWHYTGDQNPSQEYTKITNEKFDALTDKFIGQYKVGEEAGIAVVAPPPNTNVFVRAHQFGWEPILKLQKGKTYKFHLGSTDMNHGFSIQPINMNFQVVPGWDNILNITPTTTGVFLIVCNEYCGLGHHTMIGKMYVD